MEFLGKIKWSTPILSSLMVVFCIFASLSGYRAPVYAVTEHAPVIDDEESEVTTEQIPVKGSFDLEDGLYSGVGTGFAGQIAVDVEIKEQSIINIEITNNEADDIAFINKAKGVIDTIINTQNLNVDVVSGATYSSNGIISAVKNALTGEVDTSETAVDAMSSALGNSSVALVDESGEYTDGTYYGSGTGFKGQIRAKVVISSGQIYTIDIIESSDDAIYMAQALSITNKIISSQSSNVDTVSGATYSSVGIIEAVRDALNQARKIDGNSTDSQSKDDVESDDSTNTGILDGMEGKFPYEDGIYMGSAEGFNDDITVAITIKDGTIISIDVIESKDDEVFFNKALNVLNKMVQNQSTEVDVVSGATYSSEGLINAVKDALGNAKRNSDEESEAIDNENGSSSEEKEEEESEDKDTEDAKELLYNDGKYDVNVLCYPDETDQFDAYMLSVKVTIENDKIIAITDIVGDGDSSNESFINRAVNGTSSKKGVVAQIIDVGNANNIDVVTHATCTSYSIIEACQNALNMARILQ
ncbi:MAG: FMN-binding protein [Suipraeoptans sp.]